MNRFTILIEKNKKVIVIIFFLIYLLIGLINLQDYGVFIDEEPQRYLGRAVLTYIFQGDQELLNRNNAFHGPVFTTFLFAVEKILNISGNLRAVFLMRHLFTFLFFYAGVFFFYKLCKYRFKSWKIGLLGSLFLILSPRIFAHSFFNSKDIPFLSLFIISIYTLIRYLNKKTWSNGILHAVTCAILIDIRILGVIVPAFTICFFTTDLLVIKNLQIKVKKTIVSLIIYIFSLIFFTVLFWPTLWTNPFKQFIKAFNVMTNYPWPGSTFYLGNFIKATEVPWHYIPVWMAISTPIIYTICFFIGCFFIMRLLLKNPIRFYIRRRDDLIFMLWFFLSLIAVIVLNSTLYGAWRHMFFIYPAFLLVSLIGLVYLWKYFKNKFKGLRLKITGIIIIMLFFLNLGSVSYFMIKYHPYQYVYFNILAGRNMEEIKNKFPLDTLAFSYKEAFEYILKEDKSDKIKVLLAEYNGGYNEYMIPEEERERFEIQYENEQNDAKYFLSHYKHHPNEYLYDNEFYSIKIKGTKIGVIYKLIDN